MKNPSLHPTDIKLMEVEEGTTLFFHADKLQIYPLRNAELIRFLKTYAEGGYTAAEKSFGTGRCEELMQLYAKIRKPHHNP